MISEGPAALSIKLNLLPFTLIKVTTHAGFLTSPLRDHFSIVQWLKYCATTRILPNDRLAIHRIAQH